MKVTPHKTELGKGAEKHACEFLQKHGLALLFQNYRCKLGEIDLIMRDQQEVVFVEVRMRNSNEYGDAIDSIDYYKQQKLIKAANFFLLQQRWLDKVNCRFDVIGISYAQTKPNLEWIKDAFSVDTL